RIDLLVDDALGAAALQHRHDEPLQAALHGDAVAVLEVLPFELDVIDDAEDLRPPDLVEVAQPRHEVRLVSTQEHAVPPSASCGPLGRRAGQCALKPTKGPGSATRRDAGWLDE